MQAAPYTPSVASLPLQSPVPSAVSERVATPPRAPSTVEEPITPAATIPEALESEVPEQPTEIFSAPVSPNTFCLQCTMLIGRSYHGFLCQTNRFLLPHEGVEDDKDMLQPRHLASSFPLVREKRLQRKSNSRRVR